MAISQLDRVSGIMLARTIASTNEILELKGDLPAYVRRLHSYKLFTVGELSEISGMSEHKVRQCLRGTEQFRARSGIKPRHLDHLIRMVGSHDFARLHIKSLVKDGATIAGLARVSGISESTLRRWISEG